MTLRPHIGPVFVFKFLTVAFFALTVAALCCPMVRYTPDANTRMYFYYWKYVVKTNVPKRHTTYEWGNSYQTYSRNPIPYHECTAAYQKLRTAYAFTIMAVIGSGLAMISTFIFFGIKASLGIWHIAAALVGFAVLCLLVAIPIDISMYTEPHCNYPGSMTFENLGGIVLSSMVGCIVAALATGLIALCAFVFFWTFSQSDGIEPAPLKTRAVDDGMSLRLMSILRAQNRNYYTMRNSLGYPPLETNEWIDRRLNLANQYSMTNTYEPDMWSLIRSGDADLQGYYAAPSDKRRKLAYLEGQDVEIEELRAMSSQPLPDIQADQRTKRGEEFFSVERPDADAELSRFMRSRSSEIEGLRSGQPLVFNQDKTRLLRILKAQDKDLATLREGMGQNGLVIAEDQSAKQSEEEAAATSPVWSTQLLGLIRARDEEIAGYRMQPLAGGDRGRMGNVLNGQNVEIATLRSGWNQFPEYVSQDTANKKGSEQAAMQGTQWNTQLNALSGERDAEINRLRWGQMTEEDYKMGAAQSVGTVQNQGLINEIRAKDAAIDGVWDDLIQAGKATTAQKQQDQKRRQLEEEQALSSPAQLQQISRERDGQLVDIRSRVQGSLDDRQNLITQNQMLADQIKTMRTELRESGTFIEDDQMNKRRELTNAADSPSWQSGLMNLNTAWRSEIEQLLARKAEFEAAKRPPRRLRSLDF